MEARRGPFPAQVHRAHTGEGDAAHGHDRTTPLDPTLVPRATAPQRAGKRDARRSGDTAVAPGSADRGNLAGATIGRQAAPAERRKLLRISSHSSTQPAEQHEGEMAPPERNYDCANYETCLDLAAALDWRSFTCAGCCGEFDRQLLWRAQAAIKKNPALARLLSLPKPVITDPAKK